MSEQEAQANVDDEYVPPMRLAYQAILTALETHEHAGNGVCSCGAAIGWSDGLSVEVHEDEHRTDMAVRLIEASGLVVSDVE